MAQCTPRRPTRMARRAKSSCCPAPTATATPTTTTTTSPTAKRCLRPGPMQRNPYLNFLREYRKKCCGLSAVETVRQGAKAWKNLSQEERQRYIVEAFYTRKRPRGQRAICAPRGRSRSRRGGRVTKRGRSARSRRSRRVKSHKAKMC